IVAFPCNQFGAQEPGTWEEIASLADRKFGVTFPIMSKKKVKPQGTTEMYRWLR
ncbi:unnamed protein product, partial [Ectocarpus sp. 8 AP-2014]